MGDQSCRESEGWSSPTGSRGGATGGIGAKPPKTGSGSAPPEVSVNMNWTVQTTGLINGKQDYTTVGH